MIPGVGLATMREGGVNFNIIVYRIIYLDFFQKLEGPTRCNLCGSYVQTMMIIAGGGGLRGGQSEAGVTFYIEKKIDESQKLKCYDKR